MSYIVGEMDNEIESFPNITDPIEDKILNKYPIKIHRYLSNEVLSLDSVHHNDVLMSNTEAKRKGLPYYEPYDYKGRTLYKLRNTEMFSIMSKQKTIKGKYNPFPIDTREHRQLTLREIYRCLYGYKCGAIEITGYNYFYLNYSLVDLTEEINGVPVTSSKQPLFWKIHFDWFWAVDIAEKGITEEKYNSLPLDIRISKRCLSGKRHIVCAKTRRSGWSFLTQAMTMRDVAITDPRYMNFKLDYIIASKEDYVSDLFDKILTTKSYLDRETDFMFKHFYDRYDTKTRIRASEKDVEGVEIRTGGEAIGVVINKDAKKVRGKGVYKVFAEEFGVFPAGTKAMASILPLVQPGGIVTGMFIGFGTGGEETSDISAIKDCFNEPDTFNMMEFDNSIFEEAATNTGFFVPSMYTNRRFLDKDGNADLLAALEYQLQERKKKEVLDAESIVKFKAEEPICPSDIFNFGSADNPFNIDKLVEAREVIESEFIESRREILRGDTQIAQAPYHKYRLDYVSNSSGQVVAVTAVRDNNGYVYMKENAPDTLDEMVPNGLYIGAIDSIDQGAEESAVGIKGSKLAMVIKKRSAPFIEKNGNSYVAFLSIRSAKVEEAYEEALKLAILFNASINLERSKIRIINHFQKSSFFGDQSYRFCDELMALNDSANRFAKTKKMFGTAPTTKNNQLMDSYLATYINNFALQMTFLPLIEECLYYTVKQRTKFDNVVALGLCELYDESLILAGKAPTNPDKEFKLLPRYVYKTVNGKRVKVLDNAGANEMRIHSQRKFTHTERGANGGLIMKYGYVIEDVDGADNDLQDN